MVAAMSKPIRRVAVLGAGVMGSGIAAHVANAGLPVLLLDIVPREGSGDSSSRADKAARDRIAAGAVKAALKAKPAPFFHPRYARLITVGNLQDDLERAVECDVIVEAIIEKLDIKRSLFERLDRLMEDKGSDTLIASNTSGLRISDMVEGRSERFRRNFLVTHFFNPPRYMKLLEIVKGPDTDPAAVERVVRLGREILGKGIVFAKDSPNFVANRIGAHGMMSAIHLMLEMELSPEDLDAITGIPMGRPKSATFRTADVVGLDTLVHVVDNCYEVLTEDEDREVFKVPDYVRTMIGNKQLGQKTRAGFYRKTKQGIETLDPKTGEYRPKAGNADIKKACKAIAKESDVGARLRKLVATEGPIGEFAWRALSRSLAYSARRIGEICDDVVAVDNGMKWGYNWELGPFEVWDALGFEATLDRMQQDGIELPAAITKMREAGAKSFYDGDRVYDLQTGDYIAVERDPREATLTILRRGDAAVMANKGAEAWDLGDGVLGVTFKSKSNSLDPDVIHMLSDVVDRAERDFRGVLIYNQGEHFCVGANLFLVVMAAQQKQWDQLHQMIKQLQGTVQRMRYSTVPFVAAPYGMTLGGGLEVCLACDAVQAAAETYSGQVEVGVGLIPGGAGNMNLLWRALETIPDGVEYDMYPYVTQVFKNIALAEVATSAGMAKEKGYFRHTDGVSFDRARQLHEAKNRVLIALADSRLSPAHPAGLQAARRERHRHAEDDGQRPCRRPAGYATEHDALIAGKLANVLCGGVSGASHEVTEDEMLELEREAFVSLCGEPKSQERMQHMLMKNKPLRN